MNSQLRVVPLAYVRLLVAVFAFGFALALLIRGASYSATADSSKESQTQNDEKSLNFERYANEPLELVEVKIRERSVKSNIKGKVRDAKNKPVLDNVKFIEQDDWFKHVTVRLRNVSGRTVCGISAALYFQPQGLQMVFPMRFKGRDARDLFKHPLGPGEEIDLGVSQASVNEAMRYMFQHGIDVNKTTINLAVHTVYFSYDFGWAQGSFIRRDPANPKNWKAVDPAETPSPPSSPSQVLLRSEANGFFQSVGFKTVKGSSFAEPTQYLNRCQAASTGWITWACNYDENQFCDTVSYQGNGRPVIYHLLPSRDNVYKTQDRRK